MFHYRQKPIKHALELIPAHVRSYRPEKKGGMRNRRVSSGYAVNRSIFTFIANRNQRCVVKISYSKNTKTRSWAAHGEYLQREHAQVKGEKGLGFNHENDSINLKSLLRQWQQSQDPHVFKLIISPENGHRLDLKQHVKELMKLVQKDLKTKLEWAAIDHHNTDHPHVHVLIRGTDQRKQTLKFEPSYLSYGFRRHSEELATRVLGLRLDRDNIQARERQLDREYLTELDRSIRRKAVNSIVNYHSPAPQSLLSREQRISEIKRLKFLEKLALAEKIGPKSWKLADNMEEILLKMQLSIDIIKSCARHNIPTIDHEIPAPTQIQENKPLTGKVVGMGLENELKDLRYLLLEGMDGKVHYLQATDSMIKARDNFEFSNGDVITLEKRKFTNEHNKVIEHIKLNNHINLDTLQQEPKSRLDKDVIEFVKTHSIKPILSFPEKSFSHEYANAIIKRFAVLEKEKIITKNNDHYTLAHDWQNKLSRLTTYRQQCQQLELKYQAGYFDEHEYKKRQQVLEQKRGLNLKRCHIRVR
jgi:type IV secretory pathway VirD2 relaxase